MLKIPQFSGYQMDSQGFTQCERHKLYYSIREESSLTRRFCDPVTQNFCHLESMFKSEVDWKGWQVAWWLRTLDSCMVNHTSSPRHGSLLSHWEPAVSVMTMLLDSHVVDRGSCPGPGGLKLTPGACACVPKIPRGEWRRRDCGVTIPPGG